MAPLSAPPFLTYHIFFFLLSRPSSSVLQPLETLANTFFNPRHSSLQFIHPPSSPTSPPPSKVWVIKCLSVWHLGIQTKKIASLWSSHVINMNSLNPTATEETLVPIFDSLKENLVSDHMASWRTCPCDSFDRVTVASILTHWEGIEETTPSPIHSLT